FELAANFGGSATLPSHGGRNRLAGGAIPDDGCLTLVGDADCRDVAGAQLRSGQCPLANIDGGGEDFIRIVLHPAGPRIGLLDLAIGGRQDASARVEDQRGAAGGPLIERQNSSLHASAAAALKRRIGSISRR